MSHTYIFFSSWEFVYAKIYSSSRLITFYASFVKYFTVLFVYTFFIILCYPFSLGFFSNILVVRGIYSKGALRAFPNFLKRKGERKCVFCPCYKNSTGLDSFCKPETFNTNISHRLFDYIITFVNSQHLNTNSKVILYSKAWFQRWF